MNLLLKRINDFLLLFLVFAVTFENWNPFGFSGISFTYIATILYIVSWVPFASKIFKISYFRQFLIPLVLYVLVGILSTAMNSLYANELLDLVHQRMLQLIILMFLVAAHLILNPSLIPKVLVIFVMSIFAMYLLFLAGQGISYFNGRILIFGENPNLIGTKAALAFIIALGFITNKQQSKSIKILLIGTLLPLLHLTILSASRGALLSLLLGVILLTISLKTQLWKKMILIAFGMVFVTGLFIYILETNPVFRYRILSTVEHGDTGRNEIWEGAIQAIKNNLFFGVGLPADKLTMFLHGAGFRDPHNVFLWVLLTTGVVGTFFFVWFIFRIGLYLIRYSRSERFAVYFLIYTTVLLNMSKQGGAIGKILFWFLFGVLISGIYALKTNAKRNTENYENIGLHQ
ncbi:O-antigen ligase domain-containing protein [Robertkochia marina]|uniref:O-antigen ligase domain-containing protein n=1 Tax=Robertkochia marina TaxID=1227945 RepID=A0A4S3M166_9FLAO|nr:O-antigen ligase family protein [Robertkochia marina]THD66797.1 O-antigen ligase domain-containing protein [Robertkochia marina]TRZ41912.1 O-antigen ligase domain-containing protein [Robertkochia marina]